LMMLNDRVRRRLKLRDLDTLLAVAQSGSMAKAARQLSISQPAVSKAIADIEHTIGLPLFDRTAQGVEPTLYGKALLKWSVTVFDDLSQGVQELEFLADPTAGAIAIGATEPIMGGWLPAIINRLMERHPRLVFDVTEVLADPSYDELRQRKVDLMLGRILGSPIASDLTAEILFDDPQMVVAGIHNPWHRRRNVKLIDLIDEPWALPRPDSAMGSLVVETFRTAGLDFPRSHVICNSIFMYGALLANGRHLALYPRSLLHFSGERHFVKLLPIKLPALPRPVGIVTLKSRVANPVAQLFVNCAREVAKPLVTGSTRAPKIKI
jgi:DNA-binding transcriptional LysR family regulator